jgi:hypothetical protein
LFLSVTSARVRPVLVLVSIGLLFLSIAAIANFGFVSAGAALVGSLVAWAGFRFAAYRETETIRWAIALTARDVGLTAILVVSLGFLFLATREL